MEINIRTRPKNIKPKEIHTAVNFFIRKLAIKNNNLIINVTRLQSRSMEFWGLINNDGDNEYTIELNVKIPYDAYLTTIAHECVHIKQFVRREFDDELIDSQYQYWKGKKVDIFETEYHELPWEKEAREMESKLISQYFVWRKYNDV